LRRSRTGRLVRRVNVERGDGIRQVPTLAVLDDFAELGA
jgi:hypothetical protein